MDKSNSVPDDNQTSSVSTPKININNMPQSINNNNKNSYSTTTQKPSFALKTPSIFVKANNWCVAAPILFRIPGITRKDIAAQATSNGTIMIKTHDTTHFRQIQKSLISNNIDFVSSKLHEDRALKVVLRDIPTYISPEELKIELETLNFNVKLIKRFGPDEKRMPLCLVLLSNEPNLKDIYDLSELFYLKVKVESFRNSGILQCLVYQRFGHSSFNCGHPLRFVKYEGEHKASGCPKTM